MEIARRARFVWACFCVANVAVSLYMGMTGFAVAAFVGIFMFYVPTTFGKFTTFMFGYVGITALTTGGAQAFMMVGAAWLVATLVWWLVTGFGA